MRRHLLVLIASVTLLGVLPAQRAWAIPAFARKYQTSCHTCHTAYPKLNPFGNAFRLLGYRMPGETEDMIKEPPVPLGAEAYKRVWPDQIWPSDMPGTVPLAVDLRLSSVTLHEAAEDETLKNDFRFPEEVELLGAGTLGETLSFLGALGFEVESEHGETHVEVEIEHAELHFNGPWGSGSTFNAKVGRFTPEIAQGFSHGYLLTESTPAAMFGFNPLEVPLHRVPVAGFGHGGGHGGGSSISLPVGVDGIEVYGILARRFEYSGGIANGVGPGAESRDANTAKDIFGRISYKVGGLSLDGAEYEASERNWRETSLQVGLFGYRGNGEGILSQGTGHHASTFVEDQEFTRGGVDINMYWRDLNVIAGFVRGRDSLARFTTPSDEHGEPADEHGEPAAEDEHGEAPALELQSVTDSTYKGWFTELDYVFYPWLHGAYRYEWLDPGVSRFLFKRSTVNLTALIRANVKALVEWQRDFSGARKDDYLVKGALRFAF